MFSIHRFPDGVYVYANIPTAIIATTVKNITAICILLLF